MNSRLLTFITVIACCWALVACGGGGVTPEATNDVPAGQTILDDLAGTAPVVDQPASGRPIPSIPIDSDSGKDPSDLVDTYVLGSDALDFSQCEVAGDTMVINTGGDAVNNDAEVPAWALYKIGGLRDLDPFSLNVECAPDDHGAEYYVAVADYTVMDWAFFGPLTIPEFQLEFSSSDHTYVTHLGNLYLLVACYGDNVAVHSRSTVISEDGQGGNLPGAPTDLTASKGAFEDGVALNWQAGTDADGYQVERRGSLIYPGFPLLPPDGNSNPDGIPDDYPPFRDEWLMIGVTPETEYFDTQVEPGMIYQYRARAINAVGASEYSNIDEGWAREIRPPGVIHGFVFGISDMWEGDLPPNGTGPDGNPGGVPPGDDGYWPMPEPLAGAVVSLRTMDATLPIFSFTTDERGYYEVGEIIPGEYEMTCELEGWLFHDMYFLTPPDFEYGGQYDFYGYPDNGPPPGEPEGIYGYVYAETWNAAGGGDPDGNIPPGDDGPFGVFPLAGVQLTLAGFMNDGIYGSAETNADGFFQFLDVQPGEYLVQPFLEGWIFIPDVHYAVIDANLTSFGCDFIAWPDDGTDPPDPPDEPWDGLYGWVWADITMDPAGDIPPDNGILPWPLADVLITVVSEDGTYAATAVTNAEGFFNIPLDGGHYICEAMLEGWEFHPPHHPVFISADSPSAGVEFFGFPSNGDDRPPPFYPPSDPNTPPGAP